MSELATFEKRAAAVHKSVTQNKGTAPRNKAEGQLSGDEVRKNILIDIPAAVRQLDALRAGDRDRRALDISFADYARDRWGFSIAENGSPDALYAALGVDPSQRSLESLMTMPEMPEGYRWLVPEVIREAIRLGLRKQPIYSNLIAAEETVNQPTIIMPHINMSDAMPKKIGEAETIPTGTVSFGQKTVKLTKVGTGLKITDEVRQYVSLNILSLYLQDIGVQTNLALDTMLIDVLINGDQADSSEAAAVVGVANTTTGLQYIDILRAWIRMGRIGRLPNAILSDEAMALEVLEMSEFKGFSGQSTTQRLVLKTPVPQSQNYFVHGAMPDTNKIMLIDGSSAAIKLNASALRVESERIAEKQLNGTYVSMVTGFANLFRDARVILDKSIAYSGNGFPTWMNVSSAENVNFG